MMKRSVQQQGPYSYGHKMICPKEMVVPEMVGVARADTWGENLLEDLLSKPVVQRCLVLSDLLSGSDTQS